MPVQLNPFIDYTLLSQIAGAPDIERLCLEARQHGFWAVCINPVWVSLAAELLDDTSVKVCSVVGFPLGANCTEIKVAEAARAAQDGAHEIDLVANIGWLVAGNTPRVTEEIAMVRAGLPTDVLLKVIIEASQLHDHHLKKACRAVIAGGAEFVKSGTGFFGDVTVDQVISMVTAVNGQIRVKAAGGIRSSEQARSLLAAGAARLGISRLLTDSGQYR